MASFLIGRKKQGRYRLMANPPTVTRGGNGSSVDGNFVNGMVRFAPDLSNNRMVMAGCEFEEIIETGNRSTLKAAHITDAAGGKGRNQNPYRIRIETDEPELDLCFLEAWGSGFSVMIDGEIAERVQPVAFTNSGNYRYFKVSFGSDAVSYRKAEVTITRLTNGTGYALGDLITFDGGENDAPGSPMVLRVAQLSSTGDGVVVQLSIEDPGDYEYLPAGKMSQISTTGAGVGLSVEAKFFFPAHSSRKWRRWEIICNGPATFMGIVTRPEGIVIPWRVDPAAPKLIQIGDSISAGTYLQYAAGHLGTSIAQTLGLEDNYIISAVGGTGWDAGGTPWSHPNRIADFIRYGEGESMPVYLFIGSQNFQSLAATTAAIPTVINAIHAANPNAICIGLSNILGGSISLDNAIKAGWDAVADQRRAAYISSQQPIKWFDPSYYLLDWTVTNDGNHPGQAGQDLYAAIAAEQIYQKLVEMASV
ncbi:SGNH/GDSL hydrolase family protein [Luteolibacter pohnpeiensis]|uniref:SGNH/GDSL hydrolase family protein n=1 Tax=Luteolibacter pohnpeiensis TaxID=454153 RepID=A0A934VSV8_9BACT|nr:SGNH/GDSL hydrolase family protein [Luteolibacter pohnpeiensis]MBK1884736.1 SGNH/GDSL hydrolase family protein [Luteolibacter pohnpeiensis]